MKFYIAFALLLSSLTLSAQSDDFEKFHIGLLFSPEFSYRTLADKGDDSKDVIKDLNKTDKHIFGFQFGVLFDYRIKKWVAIETGIKLAKRGFQNEQNVLDGNGNQIAYSSLSFHNLYFEIPIKADFYFFEKSIVELYATAAITPGFLIQAKYKTEEAILNQNIEKSEDKNRDANVATFGSSIGIGIDITPIKQLGIRIEPFFRHSITPDYHGIRSNYEWNTYHFSFGTRIGVFYKF